MLISVTEVLSSATQARVLDAMAAAPQRAGKDSAGFAAAAVKSSTLIDLPAALLSELYAEILRHPLLALAARPKQMRPPQLVCYACGDGYGRHMDDALMHGLRTDLALSIFLSAPESYAGGELTIEDQQGEQSFRLAAGSALLYPATYLHRVEPVTRGERLVIITWIESYIRSTEQRELLFELELAKRAVFAKDGKTEAFDRLSRVASNLVRMWAG